MSDPGTTTRPHPDRELTDLTAAPSGNGHAASSGLLGRFRLRRRANASANGRTTGDPDDVLTARGLRFSYARSFQLDVESLNLRAASILGLVGPNGSGKTTLLRLLGLTMRPSAGQILLDGQPVRYGWRGLKHRRQVATVFQNPVLLDTTVRANVEAGLRFRGVRRRPRRLLAEGWLDRFGIAHLADRRARLLSGGETRRVALARALVLEPKLLLLDEPFNDLDREIRHGLQLQLRRVLEGTRAAVVLVTHDLHEGLALAERLGVMLAGRLVQTGSLRDVLDRPLGAEVASLVGMTNLWPGRVLESVDAGTRILLDDQTPLLSRRDAPPARRVIVGVRPERLRFVNSPDPAQTDLAGKEMIVPGIVRSVEQATPLVRVTVQMRQEQRQATGDAFCADVLDLPERLASLAPGDPVHLSINPEDVHLIDAVSAEVAAE